MKTILITLPFGIAARNMICAKVVEKLTDRACRVILIAPQKSFELLRSVYPDENKVVFEKYPNYERFFEGGVERDASLLSKILSGLINGSLDTGATRYRRNELLLKKKYAKFIWRWIFRTLLGGRYDWSEKFRYLDEKLCPSKWFEDLFRKYRPDAVFSPHVQFDFNLIKEARDRGVVSFGQVLSIDNLTTKGNIRSKSDYLFVWNDAMKEEAVKYNLYDPNRVISVGIPQYDIYHEKSVLMSREEFCAQIGADPKRALFVYASEAGCSPNDKELVEFLLASQKANRFVKPFSIVARTHPRDPKNPFEAFLNCPDVIINDARVDPLVFIDHWHPSYENIKFLVNLMYHSALVLMMGSTIGLDAAGFDKPVISLGFDLTPQPYYRSVRRYYDHFSHQRHWFDIRAFRIAVSRESLINEINRYLEHPEYEREERKKLIDKLFYKFDGQVGERIVDYIINKINK